MFDSRLALDQFVLGYWGFDEANVADPALDETAAARHLTVVNAASVVPARLGNGRQFDGASTQATLANAGTNAVFRQNLHLTIIAWVTLDSVLQSGSQARTIICCDGDGGVDERALYDVHVTNDGRVVYEHQNDDGAVVRWETAPGTLRTGRYYSLALVRDIAVFHMDDDDVGRVYPVVTLRLNNGVVPWEAITSGGVPLGDITNASLPASIGGSAAQTFKVGHSGRRPDAFWHGVVDELSVHYVARPVQPYLDAAYYRITLSTAFSKLTAQGDIRTVGGAEMGGGTRWWCYERSGALYVIRENSLGLFSKEILLTTGGQTPAGAPIPPGTEKPVLVYEPESDTLTVCFMSAGRLFQITAASGDAPTTQAMPLTADTGTAEVTVIKAVDSADFARLSMGSPPVFSDALGDSGIAATSLTLFYIPTFGVAVIGTNPYGYAVFQAFAGMDRLLAVLPQRQTERFERGPYYYVPVPTRYFGASYYAVPILVSGCLSRVRTAPIFDNLGSFTPENTDPNLFHWNRTADAGIENAVVGAGEGGLPGAMVLTTTTAIKMPVMDPLAFGMDHALGRDDVLVRVTTTALKHATLDAVEQSMGDSSRIVMGSSTRPEVNL